LDIGEQKNLAEKYPEKVKVMMKKSDEKKYVIVQFKIYGKLNVNKRELL
jgi:hypothetical protein